MARELTEADFPFLSELERYDFFLKLYRSIEPADVARLERLYASRDPLLPLIILQYLEDLPERPAVGAIIRLIESDSEVVARSACEAYQRSHYPAKARILKQLVLSKNDRACRFATRILSRAGFMEVLPLILRELPDREGKVRAEMIESLRYLPDQRVVGVLLPYADAKQPEIIRWRALSVLADLQPRLKMLPASYFLKLVQDPSEKIRRVAIEALQRYPTKRVAPMILAAAIDKKQPEELRIRSVRALASFPSSKWVRPLVEIAAREESSALRLSAEVSLRHIRHEELREGIVPMLRDPDPVLKRQAALFAADLLGNDEESRKALFDLWKTSDEESALELIEAIGLLGGQDAALLLRDSVKRSPVLAYSAAHALARMRGVTDAAIYRELLDDPEVMSPAKQALLDRLAKRGPDEKIRAALLPTLLNNMSSDVMNIRYLSLQTLAWYPLKDTLPAMLALLAKEANPDVVRMSSKILARGLERDPLPLVKALGETSERGALIGHVVRILTTQNWRPECVPQMLEELRKPPLSMLDERPETYFAICAHLLSLGAIELPTIWPALVEKRGGERLFLEVLASFMAAAHRRFGPMPVDFLSEKAKTMDPGARAALYDVLGIDGRVGALDGLTGALIHEEDAGAAKAGARALRRRLLEVPQ
ncbi:MAG: HEAT repeat domain-containing protein [Elusimicrobia bacterium]|nr:HEAT repeat domain-containing protein [Elusimicrobiota bacterium]